MLNAKCARCDREAQGRKMRWPPDLLEMVLSEVATERNMLRARLKKRVWREVHKELNDEWFCGISERGGQYTKSGILATHFFDELSTVRGGGRTRLKVPYIVVTNGEGPEDFEEDWFDDDTTLLEFRERFGIRSYSYECWECFCL
jgi:hypothetical protein